MAGGVNAEKISPRKLRAMRDELNGIIHRENLYVCLPGGNRRAFNAEIKDGKLTVEDLHTGEKYDVASNRFQNGYGSEVLL